MNPNTELVYAPFRSLDDFILSQSRLADMTVPPENTKNLISRFQVPEYQNMDKFRNRVVSNLIYYQTNYAVLSLVTHLFHPGHLHEPPQNDAGDNHYYTL